MAMYRVWNDNTHPYRENFKGDKIEILAKQYVEMSEDDALQFKGTFSPPIRDADGNDLPQGYKMIRIERITGEVEAPQVDELRCLACNFKASSPTVLELHSKESHAQQVVVDEEAEAALKARPKRAKAS